MRNYLPLMLDLTDKEIVIFGGGSVSTRKALLFYNYAKVTVISKEFTPELLELKHKINLIRIDELNESLIKEKLKNVYMVIPATNDKKLNILISEIAEKKGIMVNRVDGFGDVLVPSVIKKGDIIIGISTFGKSPALSKYIREKIEETLTLEYEYMELLQNRLREELKSKIKDQKKRQEILRAIIYDSEVWDALKESYENGYKAALKHLNKKA